MPNLNLAKSKKGTGKHAKPPLPIFNMAEAMATEMQKDPVLQSVDMKMEKAKKGLAKSFNY